MHIVEWAQAADGKRFVKLNEVAIKVTTKITITTTKTRFEKRC